MAKQPAGQKKSKESIAKAATQKKGGAKVILVVCRNGPRVKSKRKLTTQSFLTKQPMIDLSQVSPSWASTSQHPPSLKSTKS